MSGVTSQPVERDHLPGQLQKLALVAVIRKLIGILNVMLQRNQMWHPTTLKA